jgi:hypothetical protein
VSKSEASVALSVDILMDGAMKALESTAIEQERVHGRHWDARVEVIRNVVSVNAVVLAGTIAFIDKAPPRASTGAFLVSCWLVLVVSLALGLYVLWQSMTLRSFYPKLFNAQLYLREQFSQVDLSHPDARTPERGDPNARYRGCHKPNRFCRSSCAMGDAGVHGKFRHLNGLPAYLRSFACWISWAIGERMSLPAGGSESTLERGCSGYHHFVTAHLKSLSAIAVRDGNSEFQGARFGFGASTSSGAAIEK